jgi:hypothetical protein
MEGKEISAKFQHPTSNFPPPNKTTLGFGVWKFDIFWML